MRKHLLIILLCAGAITLHAEAADGKIPVQRMFFTPSPVKSGYLWDVFINRQMAAGPQPRFRLLLQAALLEFYLNDQLIQTYALPEPATGRLGLIHNGNPDCIDQLEAWN